MEEVENRTVFVDQLGEFPVTLRGLRAVRCDVHSDRGETWPLATRKSEETPHVEIAFHLDIDPIEPDAYFCRPVAVGDRLAGGQGRERVLRRAWAGVLAPEPRRFVGGERVPAAFHVELQRPNERSCQAQDDPRPLGLAGDRLADRFDDRRKRHVPLLAVGRILARVAVMNRSEDRAWGPRTRAIHAGARPDPTTGARAVPIYQTTSFVFEDTQDAADLFALQKYGNIYSRLANPTVAAFEERIASLEGGIGAVATASGQAAETLLFTSLAHAGDHIVASSALYGGTFTLLDVTLRRLGIETTFVAPDDPAAFAAAIVPGRTKLVYTEIIANPAGTVADLAALAEVAHAAGVPLVVDSTLATPHLCRPFEHGADIVVHSATKFLGGHGTSIAGVVVDSGRFAWDNGNFPVMTEPVATYGNLRFWDNFGEYGFCTKMRVEGLRNLGPALSPFNAFLILQGMETLSLRMGAHVENAVAVARWLADDPRVDWVRYAGLPGDPNHALAAKYLPAGAGAILSFGVRGGRAAGEAFIGAVDLCSHLANVGDTRTLVIHPASTTHRQLSTEALDAAGVSPDLVRVSVGIEDVDDILYDIDRALDASQGVT